MQQMTMVAAFVIKAMSKCFISSDGRMAIGIVFIMEAMSGKYCRSISINTILTADNILHLDFIKAPNICCNTPLLDRYLSDSLRLFRHTITVSSNSTNNPIGNRML